MGVTYSVADYMAPFLICTIGSMLAVGVLCIILVRKLTKKFRRLWLTYIPIAGYIVFLCFLYAYAVPVLEQTGDLLVPNEYEIKTTAGRITNVTPAKHVPLYLINGAVCNAEHIVIDESSYYVISEDLLTEGMLVELQYAHFENNVVLSWQETSQEQAEKVIAVADSTEKPEPQPKGRSPKTEKPARVLIMLGIAGFIAVGAFSELWRDKIADYLFRKDAEIHGRIIPNRASVLFLLIPILFMSIFVAGSTMARGDYGILFVFILSVGLMSTFALVEQFTYLEIDGRHLLLRRLWKQTHYTIEDICSVKWKKHRGIIGKSMIIVFNDGTSCAFNMDRHLGVQNAYNELIGHLGGA